MRLNKPSFRESKRIKEKTVKDLGLSWLQQGSELRKL